MRYPFLRPFYTADSGGGSGAGGQGPTPEGQGNNQGQADQPDTPAGDNGGTTPKTFTQADVDKIVKQRLAEQDQRLKAKFTVDQKAALDQALGQKDTEVEQLVSQRVQAELARRAVDQRRQELQAQYGLTEAQASRLAGDTPEDLAKDAETLYGAFVQKKDAPAVPTGGNNSATAPASTEGLNLDNMTPEQIRQNAGKLWGQLVG